MKTFFAALSFIAMLLPSAVRAESPDLSIIANSISFSVSQLYSGDTVRLYASVRNIGDVDVTGFVYFYQGSMPIGRSQTISARAGGAQDEVFVDFVVPTGSFNIRAVIQGTSPQDINPNNDVAVTPLYRPIADADRDGIVDAEDNCVTEANADQLDTDHDGAGNVCDTDQDDDGVVNDNDPEPINPDVTGLEREEEPAPVLVTQTDPPPTPPQSGGATEASATLPGSTGESEGDQAGDDATATAISTSIISKLKISPNARFTYEPIDWRTYEFIILQQPEEAVQFTWDFGDGASSVQPKITHSFSGSGSFDVTLSIIGADGTRVSDVQHFEISFFHLSNPLVQIILGALFIVLAALGVVTYKVNRRIVMLTAKQKEESV
ncbi:MAG: PKD domain-containing protein [Candidatus Uhrbacteria bacterium]|nr:PKD domain-containing protein [Candidatus Uhrbacteria bacterium]